MCGLKLVFPVITVPLTKSHPAWVCGLKLLDYHSSIFLPCHTLRGCVDWNAIRLQSIVIIQRHTLRGCVDWNAIRLQSIVIIQVTPCVGVWIETLTARFKLVRFPGHTLRGCVDWNCIVASYTAVYIVTPCVGVWIETTKIEFINLYKRSHPAWVCGLKHNGQRYCYYGKSHTLRGCVDWNRLAL